MGGLDDDGLDAVRLGAVQRFSTLSISMPSRSLSLSMMICEVNARLTS